MVENNINRPYNYGLRPPLPQLATLSAVHYKHIRTIINYKSNPRNSQLFCGE